MQGFKIEFSIYADTQEEASQAEQDIKSFISSYGEQGIAVTARKISDAVTRWKNNFFVKNFFKK